MRRLSVLLMMLFVVSALFSWASSSGGKAISGTVLGANGAPLVGSTITLVGSGRGTTTNEKGFYRLTGVREGAYTLRASYIGYKTKEVKVDVKDNVTLNITLEAQSVLGSEVVVSATRASKRTPMAFTDLKAYEIKQQNAGGDVAQIFELTPSFVATTESGIGIGNTAFSIRGTDASRINITVDGFPINDPESQQVFFVNMPDITSSASSVQIQRGVGTSTNGSGAFGATVNFQTGALSSEPYAELNNYLGSYNSWRSNALLGTGIINNRFSFDARISRAKSDGYMDRATSDHKSAQVSGTYYGDRSTLKASIIYGEEHTGISWTGVPSSVIDTNRTYNPEGIYYDSKGVRHIYDNQTDNYKQTHYLVNYTNKLTEKATLNLGFFFTHGEGYYDNYKDDAKFSKYGLPTITVDNVLRKKSDFIVQKWLDNDNIGSTFSFVYAPVESLNFTWGGSVSRFTNDHFGKIKWAEFSHGIPVDYEWYRSKSTKDDANTYLKAAWQATSQLSFFGDLQYRYVSYKMKGLDDDMTDISQSHRFDFWNPKFGAYYTIDEQNSLFASVSVAHREPTRSDYTDNFKSDKHVTFERLIDYEAGYKYAGTGLSLGVNLYYMQYKDQLVLTGKLNNVGYPIRENAPKSYRTGVELMAAVKILDNLKWEGNLTLSQNKIKNFTYSVELYDNQNDWNFVKMNEYYLGTTSISFSPTVIGSSMITFEPLKNLKVDLISKYVGKQYYDNSQSEKRKLNAYFVNNLRAGYDFSVVGLKNLTLQVGVNNLFNEKYIANAWIYRAEFQDNTEYIEDGLFPQATRNYWCRLALRF
jgi:iron complex outermembrane receptor protein